MSNTLRSQIEQALGSLARRHGVETSGPAVRHNPARRTARLERDDANRRRQAASNAERSIEGSYAEVEIITGTVVTVFVLTVERTGFGTKATCKRLDNRQTIRVRLDDLQNVRGDA